MELGLYTFADVGPGGDPKRRMGELVEEIELADGVGLDVFLAVARALGQLDRVVAVLDPYETDLGRARADETLPERVRR